MALLPGGAGIGRALTDIASRMSPPKTMLSSQPPTLQDGMTPALDPAQGSFSPPKVTNFTGAFEDPTLAGMSGSPQKVNVADMFALPPAPGMTPQQAAGQAPVGSGLTSLGGDWANVDRWDSVIAAASAKTGVPANLIKAVMKLESNGENLGPNSSTAVGPMQVTTSNWSNLGYDLFNPEQNIFAGATILKQMYDTMGDWEGATRAYFAGPGGAYTGNQDSFGTNPNTYWSTVNSNWQALDAAGGSFSGNSGGFGGGMTSGNVMSLFGQGASVHDWGEFAAPSGNGLYGYGTSYGLNGTQHTGLDVAMNVGTPLFAPGSGVVTCAGTGNGPGADGGGCAAFSDYFGNGAGRVEVQLDNGAVLIYGHSSTASVRPGQRVTAGTPLGTSGGMNSPHIHLEARVRDASMPSGWRIVDPRTVLGGGIGMGGGLGGGTSSYGGQQPTSSYQPMSFRQDLRNFQQGYR
jgi:murein DD-endopeptidase MepM/ murein hydrolase activator NlpD